ncbi:MAG TPA: hypothetical protein VKB96_15540 [Gammaproteobacteria bacterium]|nr:hypothetical protein [Gammaproteobacteria bacterium]
MPDAGATRGFYVQPGGNFNSIFIGTDFTKFQRLSLPPGNYIANASAVLASQDTNFHQVDCVFMIGGNIASEVASGTIGGNFGNFISLPLTLGFKLSNPEDLVLACRADALDVVSTQGSPITAIRVNRLTIQPGFSGDEP